MTTIEQTALNNLIHNETYARKVLPFIKGDYFSDRTERTIFEEIEKFIDKYHKIPTTTTHNKQRQNNRTPRRTEQRRIVSGKRSTEQPRRWVYTAQDNMTVTTIALPKKTRNGFVRR